MYIWIKNCTGIQTNYNKVKCEILWKCFNGAFRKSWWIRLSTQHYCVVLEAAVELTWRSTFQADILLSDISKILFICIQYWYSLACFNSLISYQQSQKNVIYLTFFFVWRHDWHVSFFVFLTFPRLFKVCLQHYDPTLRRQVSVLFQVEFRLYLQQLSVFLEWI